MVRGAALRREALSPLPHLDTRFLLVLRLSCWWSHVWHFCTTHVNNISLRERKWLLSLAKKEVTGLINYALHLFSSQWMITYYIYLHKFEIVLHNILYKNRKLLLVNGNVNVQVVTQPKVINGRRNGNSSFRTHLTHLTHTWPLDTCALGSTTQSPVIE